MLKIRGMSISGNLLMGVNRFGHGLTSCSTVSVYHHELYNASCVPRQSLLGHGRPWKDSPFQVMDGTSLQNSSKARQTHFRNYRAEKLGGILAGTPLSAVDHLFSDRLLDRFSVNTRLQESTDFTNTGIRRFEVSAVDRLVKSQAFHGCP